MNNKFNGVLISCIVLIVIFISIGYSALNEELNITGELTYRPEQDIRIVNFVPKSVPSNMMVKYADFSKSEVKLGFYPEATEASATYDVTVKNKSNSIFVINEIIKTGTDNISYELTDYKIGQGIGKADTITFSITFKYNGDASNEVAQAVDLSFNFVKPYAEILKYDNSKSKSKCSDVQCALDDLYNKLR